MRLLFLGAGAIGTYVGGSLAAAGHQITFSEQPDAAATIAEHGLRLTRGGVTTAVRDFAIFGSAQAALEAGPYDAMVFALKSFDTETALDGLLATGVQLPPVLSLQNGVDNVDLIEEAAGLSALPCAVYVAVETAGPRLLKHHGRGDLAIGSGSPIPRPGAAPAGDDPRPAAVSAVFERAGVPCPVTENVATVLWTKLVMNCALNAISALGPVNYGRMVEDPATQRLIRELADETVAVARAVGVPMPDDLAEAACKLAMAMHGMYSSTAQDLMRGRRTEIDSLNGLVARLAERHGVPVPLNRMLHSLVRMAEASTVRQPIR